MNQAAKKIIREIVAEQVTLDDIVDNCCTDGRMKELALALDSKDYYRKHAKQFDQNIHKINNEIVSNAIYDAHVAICVSYAEASFRLGFAAALKLTRL